MKITNKKDIMLLLLYSPGATNEVNEPIVGRTRLVKLLFLFKEEALSDFKKGTKIKEEQYYLFEPWHYGPFEPEVYNDLNFFSLRGIINLETTPKPIYRESVEEFENWEDDIDLNEENVYLDEKVFLSSSGEKFVEKHLWSDLTQKQVKILYDFKKQYNRLGLRHLLDYVYSSYPQYITKSKIKDKILGRD